MIRQLRDRHFHMAMLLALVVPLILIVALVARRRFPTRPLPPPLSGQTPE